MLILSRIKPLWLPPSTTRGISHPNTNQFIRTPIPTKPRAGTDHPYRCQSSAGLLKLSSPTISAKSCSAQPTIPSVIPVLITCCLPDLFTHSDCLPPAWPRLPCVYSITCLPACLDPAFLLRLRFSHSSIIPDAVTRSVPVWLVVPSNKAAYGSQRHWLCVTNLMDYWNILAD